MATYSGSDLGIIEEISTTVAPKDRQINAFPGVDGIEVLDLGARGGATRLRGVLAGVSVADLNGIKASFRTAQLGGGAATFVDADGVTWAGVILVAFAPTGRRFVLCGGGVAQRYDAEFLHTR